MKSKILLALLLCAGICYGQEEELPTIIANRPGYTWGTEVLQHHKVAWENGFQFEKSTNGAKTLSLSSSVLRYGIFKGTEIYLGTGAQVTDEGQVGIGIAPMLFGAKIKCYEGEGYIPSVGVLAEFRSPHIGSKDLLPSNIAPSLYLLLEQPIFESLSLCYNAGLEWDGESSTPSTFLALGAWFSITDQLGGYLETNNYLHPEGNQYLTEFGLTWLASRRVQLDLEADLDFKNLGGYYAIGFGVAWLVN